MILDACCGAMLMYQNWNERLGDELVSIDIRKGDFSIPKMAGNWAEQKVIIQPTIRGDMKFLPFRDNVFDAVVLDPPHLDVGLGSFMDRKYGCWSQTDLIRTLKAVKIEFERVLKPNGFLFIKSRRKYWLFFETLLKNFTFFLPIERRSGAFRYKGTKILWAVGQLKGD